MKALTPFPKEMPTDEQATFLDAVRETQNVMAHGVDAVCLTAYAEALSLNMCAQLVARGYPAAARRLFDELKKGREVADEKLAAVIDLADARSRRGGGPTN